MKTNSRIKNYASYQDIPKGITGGRMIRPGSGNTMKKRPAPNYSSMKSAVQAISDPAPFDFLKTFYGLK